MKWIARFILLFLLFASAVFSETTPHHKRLKALLIFREDMMVHKMVVNRLKKGLKEGTKFNVSFKGILPQALYQPQEEGMNVDLVIALGDVALQYALLKTQYRRGIYLLISNADLKARAEATGIWTGTMLWVPLDIQLSILHKTFPNIRKVGTIVTKSNSHMLRAELKQASSQELPLLKVKTLESPSEILKTAADLFKDVDAFIFYPDPVVFNSATIEEVLKLQKELNVPVIAPAKVVARLGAYASIAYDLDALLAELRRHLMDESHVNFEKKCCIEVAINPKIGNMLQVPWEADSKKIQWKIRHLGD